MRKVCGREKFSLGMSNINSHFPRLRIGGSLCLVETTRILNAQYRRTLMRRLIPAHYFCFHARFALIIIRKIFMLALHSGDTATDEARISVTKKAKMGPRFLAASVRVAGGREPWVDKQRLNELYSKLCMRRILKNFTNSFIYFLSEGRASSLVYFGLIRIRVLNVDPVLPKQGQHNYYVKKRDQIKKKI